MDIPIDEMTAITDQLIFELNGWQFRSLAAVYPFTQHPRKKRTIPFHNRKETLSRFTIGLDSNTIFRILFKTRLH